MDSQVTHSQIDTLVDLLGWIDNDTSLSHTRRRDLGSSLRAIARLTGIALEHLPCNLSSIRPLIEKLHPVQIGISKKRLQNIRSDLTFAIQHVRNLGHKSSQRPPLSEGWQVLKQQLNSKQLRSGLSGFFHYCSHLGIAPEEVTNQCASDYYEYLLQNTLRRHPKRVYRDTCRLWNRASEQTHNWPDIKLEVPSFREPVQTLPWETFPMSFQGDCHEHLEWLGGKDLLNDHQPPHICKPATLNLRRKQIQLLASSAIKQGFPLNELISLKVLTSRPVVELSLKGYLEKTNDELTIYLRDLVRCLFSIARHWVQVDETHLEWLRMIIRRFNSQPPGLTPKNRDMLRQYDSDENLQLLLGLSEKLFNQSSKLSSPVRAAVRFQLGLLIEILLMAPMRIGNLAALRTDQHISRPRGIGGPAILVLESAETKNSTSQEYPLPDATVVLLDIYLTDHRPVLLKDPSSPWLWPGASDNHKSERTISQQVKEIIYKETGLSMTVHQFRHFAAYLILHSQPGNYELAKQLLGHKNMKTTVNFYAGLRNRSAVELYDQLITKTRLGDKK